MAREKRNRFSGLGLIGDLLPARKKASEADILGQLTGGAQAMIESGQVPKPIPFGALGTKAGREEFLKRRQAGLKSQSGQGTVLGSEVNNIAIDTPAQDPRAKKIARNAPRSLTPLAMEVIAEQPTIGIDTLSRDTGGAIPSVAGVAQPAPN